MDFNSELIRHRVRADYKFGRFENGKVDEGEAGRQAGRCTIKASATDDP